MRGYIPFKHLYASIFKAGIDQLYISLWLIVESATLATAVNFSCFINDSAKG
jgi:hypothetical protein